MDIPSGSVPARIDSTMPGAKLFSERILVTYDGLQPGFPAMDAQEDRREKPLCPDWIAAEDIFSYP